MGFGDLIVGVGVCCIDVLCVLGCCMVLLRLGLCCACGLFMWGCVC